MTRLVVREGRAVAKQRRSLTTQLPGESLLAQLPGTPVTVECADYASHYAHHRQAGDGAWVCLICTPHLKGD